MIRERIKEFITYWYFRFPKWVWATLILLLFVIFNLFIGEYFPNWFSNEGEKSWVSQIASFYIGVIVFGIIGIIVLGGITMVFMWIYKQLPDDPRKQKGEEE